MNDVLNKDNDGNYLFGHFVRDTEDDYSTTCHLLFDGETLQFVCLDRINNKDILGGLDEVEQHLLYLELKQKYEGKK